MAHERNIKLTAVGSSPAMANLQCGRALSPRVVLLMLISAAFLLLAAPRASAAAAPGWTLDSFASPANFSAADNSRCAANINIFETLDFCDHYEITAANAGSAATDGSPAIISDTLPAGVTAQRIAFYWHGPGAEEAGVSTVDLGEFLCETATVQCTSPFTLGPDDSLEMIVYVTVDEPATDKALTNTAMVRGSGAPAVSTSSQNAVA